MQYIEQKRTQLIREAMKYADQYGVPVTPGNPAGHNDARDAFRHAYSSALIAYEYSESLSKLMGDYNEYAHQDDDPREYNMDQWNNEAGRNIAREVENSGYAGNYKDEIARKVYEALQRGDLIQSLDDARQWQGTDFFRGAPDPEIPYFLDGISILEQSVLDFESAEDTVVSPIILDLDGDGVETLGVNGGAYFDHDGNGFAESTGWVGADDGLLVWDRNGDGRINDGKELFGSETLLADGTKAANGYAVLAELDTNADGKVDANDIAFASLKVWKDLDGDGYSSTSELFALADVGVQSINTGATGSTYTDPNGNQHKLTGTFTKTDGSTGSTADVWFQTDPLYTIQEDYLAVPADIAALPDLRGYGNVYDLQQAMVRDTTGSLKTSVQNFVAETDVEARETLMEQILFKWTGADAVAPGSRGQYFDAQKLHAMERFFGRHYLGSNGSSDPAYNTGDKLNMSYQGLFDMFYAQFAAQTHLKSLYDLVAYSWDSATQAVVGELSAVRAEIDARYATDPAATAASLTELARSIKGLKAEATLPLAVFLDNPAYAQAIDLAEFTYVGTDASETITGSNGGDRLWGLEGHNTIYGRDGDDLIVTARGNDVIDAGAGNDVVSDFDGNNAIGLGAGDDTLTIIGGGDNLITGGDGADSVTISYAGTSRLDGGAGDDLLRVTHYTGTYRDAGWYGAVTTFVGGTGTDRLEGSTGYDTYVFNRGDGADTILDLGTSAYSSGYVDPDRVEFGAGIVRADLAARRSGNHAVLTVADPANPSAIDQITIENWFLGLGYRIETFAFADSTTLGISDINALLATGTEGDDVIAGWLNEGLSFQGLGGNDTLSSGTGNDTYAAGDGNDVVTDTGGNNTIDLGAGDDTVTTSGNGNQTITAGAGHDTIVTQTGNDTIYTGDGNDTVTDGGGHNLVDLGVGDDTLTVGGGGDQTVYGGAGNDAVTIAQNSRTSRLEGGAGADLLRVTHHDIGYDAGYHNATTTFVGGTGDDRLEGSSGYDTYAFNRGDGADTILDLGINPSGWSQYIDPDRVEFGAGIGPLDIVFSQSGNSLLMATHGTTDSVTVENWYAGSQYQIETLRAGDGSTLTNTQVGLLIQAMAAFSANNGGMTWDQAIDQRPDDVQAVLAANWMPAA